MASCAGKMKIFESVNIEKWLRQCLSDYYHNYGYNHNYTSMMFHSSVHLPSKPEKVSRKIKNKSNRIKGVKEKQKKTSIFKILSPYPSWSMITRYHKSPTYIHERISPGMAKNPPNTPGGLKRVWNLLYERFLGDGFMHTRTAVITFIRWMCLLRRRADRRGCDQHTLSKQTQTNRWFLNK